MSDLDRKQWDHVRFLLMLPADQLAVELKCVLLQSTSVVSMLPPPRGAWSRFSSTSSAVKFCYIKPTICMLLECKPSPMCKNIWAAHSLWLCVQDMRRKCMQTHPWSFSNTKKQPQCWLPYYEKQVCAHVKYLSSSRNQRDRDDQHHPTDAVWVSLTQLRSKAAKYGREGALPTVLLGSDGCDSYANCVLICSSRYVMTFWLWMAHGW